MLTRIRNIRIILLVSLVASSTLSSREVCAHKFEASSPIRQATPNLIWEEPKQPLAKSTSNPALEAATIAKTTITTAMSPVSEFVSNNLPLLNLLAYIANIGLVNGAPFLFNLPDNGQISQKYQTIVTPAGWAFAIWGIIFLSQLVWAVLQFTVPSIKTNSLVTDGVRMDYLAVCAAQVAWTFAFAFEHLSLSMVFMVGILVSLARIYRNQQKVVDSLSHDESSLKDYWLLRFPFGLHFGWIIAATLLNANLVLVGHSQAAPGAAPQMAAALGTLVTLLGVTAATLWEQSSKSSPDLVLPLVFVWALNAIYVELKNPKRLITSTFSASQIAFVQKGAAVTGTIVLVSTVAVKLHSIWKHQRNTPEQEPLLNN